MVDDDGELCAELRRQHVKMHGDGKNQTTSVPFARDYSVRAGDLPEGSFILVAYKCRKHQVKTKSAPSQKKGAKQVRSCETDVFGKQHGVYASQLVSPRALRGLSAGSIIRALPGVALPTGVFLRRETKKARDWRYTLSTCHQSLISQIMEVEMAGLDEEQTKTLFEDLKHAPGLRFLVYGKATTDAGKKTGKEGTWNWCALT